MKLLILSDLHLEFYRDPSVVIQAFPRDGYDVVVLAGDIVSNASLGLPLRNLCDYFAPKPIIFVAGNHEYYKGNRKLVTASLLYTQKQKQNFTWLENNHMIIEGRKFVGTTMWFKRGPHTDRLSHGLGDFHHIEDFSDWNYQANEDAVNFLLQNVTESTIVVTHHLPTQQSVHERYKGDPFNCFFVCDMERLIAVKQPPIWIHGHTHEPVDYMVGDTRVVCNPLGYPDEGGGKFRRDFVVEV